MSSLSAHFLQPTSTTCYIFVHMCLAKSVAQNISNLVRVFMRSPTLCVPSKGRILFLGVVECGWWIFLSKLALEKHVGAVVTSTKAKSLPALPCAD